MNHCKGCAYFEPTGEGRDGQGNAVPVGTCMRYPPQITVNGPSSFPVVGADTSWCGEFRAKPKPTTKPKGRRK